MFRVVNEAQRTKVYLYGTIGGDWWDDDDAATAKGFAKQLDELSPQPLDIHIDSTGGDVYEGFAIASAIQRYEGKTTAYIDGIAASAASYIAVMADKVVMSDYAQFMIHKAWTFAMGNTDELQEVIKRLEALDSTIAGILAARSGQSIEEINQAMSAETWYTAQESVDMHFADEIIETEERMAACLDRDLLKHYRNVPSRLALFNERTPDEEEKKKEEEEEEKKNKKGADTETGPDKEDDPDEEKKRKKKPDEGTEDPDTTEYPEETDDPEDEDKDDPDEEKKKSHANNKIRNKEGMRTLLLGNKVYKVKE